MEYRDEKFESTSPKQWKVATIVLSILFVGAVATLIVFNTDSRKHKEMADKVEGQRLELANELEGLGQEYELQISDNEMLKDSLTLQLAEVENLQSEVRKAETQLKESKAGSNKIKAQLEGLEKVKTELENAIASLTDQNESLQSANTSLKEVLVKSEKEVEQLQEKTTKLTASNEKLVSRLTEIAPAGFTAENFVITAHKRNEKLTTRASRADKINITFDIENVPGNYNSDHEIYLVITDLNGTPISNVTSVDASVKTGENIWPVQAAQVEKLTLEGNQPIEMSIKPEDDLDPGVYNLMVYADNGFLGATGFRLR